MHFSIPDVQEFNSDSGSFTGYNIHINGQFHCTVRYKQLLNLHEQLRHQFPNEKLPQFPPKKFLPLTNLQLEDRRILLERYLQLIGQSLVFSNNDLVIGFLAAAQQETHSAPCQEVTIEVHIMNDCKVPLTILSTECSNRLLEKVCHNVSLTRELIKYFSLFLMDWDNAKSGYPALKKLENYEAPYISQKYVRQNDKIVLRKSYWDPCYDVDLMIDNVALDLLYVQTIADVDLGWISTNSSIRDRLRQYQENGQKREYMEFIRSLRHYGRIPAGEAIAEGIEVISPPALQGPQSALSITTSGANSYRVRLALISRELILTVIGPQPREVRFRVTRMRGWRITTLHVNDNCWNHYNGQCASNGSSSSSSPTENCPQYELSFEYLISKDHLEWITLKSVHVTFVSVCLQSIVHELMRQKCGSSIDSGLKRRDNKVARLIYIRRDGSSYIHTPLSNSHNGDAENNDYVTSPIQPKETFSIKRLSEKFASVAFKSGRDCVENDAFEGIGDDDL